MMSDGRWATCDVEYTLSNGSEPVKLLSNDALQNPQCNRFIYCIHIVCHAKPGYPWGQQYQQTQYYHILINTYRTHRCVKFGGISQGYRTGTIAQL